MGVTFTVGEKGSSFSPAGLGSTMTGLALIGLCSGATGVERAALFVITIGLIGGRTSGGGGRDLNFGVSSALLGGVLGVITFFIPEDPVFNDLPPIHAHMPAIITIISTSTQIGINL